MYKRQVFFSDFEGAYWNAWADVPLPPSTLLTDIGSNPLNTGHRLPVYSHAVGDQQVWQYTNMNELGQYVRDNYNSYSAVRLVNQANVVLSDRTFATGDNYILTGIGLAANYDDLEVHIEYDAADGIGTHTGEAEFVRRFRSSLFRGLSSTTAGTAVSSVDDKIHIATAADGVQFYIARTAGGVGNQENPTIRFGVVYSGSSNHTITIDRFRVHGIKY